MIEVSGTSSFCSNPDALGIDESEKGIFDSLKNIAHLSSSPPKEGDRLGGSAAVTAESHAVEEAGWDSSTAGTGERLDVIDWLFRRAFAYCLCSFQISRSRTSRRVLLLPPILI